MAAVIQVKIVLTLVAGIYCDEIEFHTSKVMSPCPSKARQGLDTFYLTGEIKADIPSYLLLAEPTVNVTMLRYTTREPLTACFFLLTPTSCAGVSRNQTYTCRCVFISQRRVSFTANLTLQAIDSDALVQVVWYKRGGVGTVLASEYRSVQEVRDLQNVTLTFTVAGATQYVLKSRFCIFDMTLRPDNILQLCCSETAMPCYPQISFRGIVVANNETPCVTYSVSGQSATGTLVLSFSLCTRSDYITGSDCEHRRGAVTTRATTTTTGAVTTRATTTTTGAVTTRATTTTTTSDEVHRETGVLTPAIDEVTGNIQSITVGLAVSTDVSIYTDGLQKITMNTVLEILLWAVITISLFVILIFICTYAIVVGSMSDRASTSDYLRGYSWSLANEDIPVGKSASVKSLSAASNQDSETTQPKE